MRTLKIIAAAWPTLALVGASCGSSQTPPVPAAATLPASSHLPTWDAELTAVADVLAQLDPRHARLQIGGTGPLAVRVISPTSKHPDEVRARAAGDTCSTHPSGILCSERTITSLLGRRSDPVHPVLLFLIAHELDHVHHGELGGFAMPPLWLEAGASSQEIVAKVKSSACATPAQNERRADDFARSVVGNAIGAGVFARGSGDLGLSAVSVLNTMFEAALQAPAGGDHSTAPLLESLSEATLNDTVEHVLCMIAPGQDHAVAWQGFPGGYDTEGVRLIRTAERLTDELTRGGYGMAAQVGNLRQLLQTWAGVQHKMMIQHAGHVTAVAHHVCEQMDKHADPWRDLHCAEVTPREDPRVLPSRPCPAMEAPATGEPISVPMAERPASPALGLLVRGDELRGAVNVTAVAVRRSGLLIAAGDHGKLVSWTGATLTEIGEAGCVVGGIAEVETGLVAVCQEGDAIVQLARGRRTTTRLSRWRVEGEPKPPEAVQVSWVGVAASRVVAAVHLPRSGHSVLAEVTPDGLRPARAWTAPGCDAIPFAVRVTELGGQPWAAPAHQELEPQAIRLSPDLGSVLQQLQPDSVRGQLDLDDPRIHVPIMSCHPSPARGVQLCVTMNGDFVDAASPFDKVLARIAPPISFAPGTVDVQSCGTKHADLLMVIERGTRAQVFELLAGRDRAALRWQAPVTWAVDSADLVCGGETAVLRLSGSGASTVVRLGPGRQQAPARGGTP